MSELTVKRLRGGGSAPSTVPRPSSMRTNSDTQRQALLDFAAIRRSSGSVTRSYGFQARAYRPIQPKKARSSKLDHFVGFRRMKQCMRLEDRIEDQCDIISEHLANAGTNSMGVIRECIESGLRSLQSTQRKLFELTDRIGAFVSANAELTYMQENLEYCIRNSIQDFKIERRELISLDWCDSHEFHAVVHTLMSAVDEATPPNAARIVADARQAVKDMRLQSQIRTWVCAGEDLEAAQAIDAKLKQVLKSINESSIKRQAILSGVATLVFDIKTTEHRLANEIARLNQEYAHTPTEEVRDNIALLREMIRNARAYDKELADAQRKVLDVQRGEDSEKRFKNRQRFSTMGSPGTPRPEWATNWERMRIHRSRERVCT